MLFLFEVHAAGSETRLLINIEWSPAVCKTSNIADVTFGCTALPSHLVRCARHVLKKDLKLVEPEARFWREYRAEKGHLQFIKSGHLPHGGSQGLLAWHLLSRRNKILRSMMSSVWECAIKRLRSWASSIVAAAIYLPPEV